MSQYIAHMGISRRRLKKERSITEETSRISNRSVSHFTSPAAFEPLTNYLVFGVELVLATDVMLMFRVQVIHEIIWIFDYTSR